MVMGASDGSGLLMTGRARFEPARRRLGFSADGAVGGVGVRE